METECDRFHGPDLCRAEDPDYWVKALGRQVDSSGLSHVVVPDVRLEKGGPYIHALGDMVILTRHPGYDGRVEDGTLHASEAFAASAYPWDVILTATNVQELEAAATAWIHGVHPLLQGGDLLSLPCGHG
jgi:hypothetical protein